MKGFIRTCKADPAFWSVLLIVFTISGISLAVFSSREIFFSLNSIHTLYLDTFFQNYTLLGDGVFSIAIFLILLLVERTALAMQVITSYLFSGIVSQLLKRAVQAPRPHAIISNAEYPYFIEGITHTGTTSFPSGHTTSVFALATILALNTKDKRFSLIYLITAIITGYSRIYLGQHFLADVTAGALIGTLSGLLVYWYLRQVRIEWVGVERGESYLKYY
ncbi:MULTISPECIES: phosphatase PAP2 family protein [Niastella]|uniref:Phosphatase PAP2 family protein n=1 Tax=Niastella soli TaxID=2821487 RepID=A0ABS3Z4R5_9BACT|nr:phosphatase PAP2 family protein [Niastella soli]MBO9205163.1 phosphatase PAP2 family protein [Niastella soli]